MDTPGALHHVELYVSDLRRSREFWSWLLERLGYALHQEWEQGFSFKLGPTHVVFVQAQLAHLAAGYHRKRIGLNHLAFHAGSIEELARLRAELETHGVILLYSDTFRAPMDTIFFEDPDRIKVELVSSARFPQSLLPTRDYRRQYDEPIRLEAGDRVRTVAREDDVEGWTWCVREPDGREGWVPTSLLHPVAGTADARVARAYTALELNARAGEKVTALREEAGWYWCRNSAGEEGWLPNGIF